VRLEGLGKLKKQNSELWNRTRDPPACSVVPPFVLHTLKFVTVKRVISNVPKDEELLAKEEQNWTKLG
jgi:hypothetical protein